MNFLQYDVIKNTSIRRKYKEKIYKISMPLLNFLLAILCYNKSLYDMIRSQVSFTCWTIIIKKSLKSFSISYFELLNVIYCFCQL